ncbi:uncharacterized protein KY384_007207 [Bacidia gigantensis]|uniref:uncharacterized protein n=1 Tax=Bacidia gigantensis TaxID=2732470 RepID=UPI001D049796|nr:uncharacterized protein KY384_007207 [Bacidia gigantensis]KAG8528290.1 hypothetical protein KY384_007207 [Bacidia gigantensis]
MKLTPKRFRIRWDSSDPDRAPPPLPLNPGAASPATKPNTSKSISLAAEKLAAKARESNYTTNSSPTKSPDKSIPKGHKRLESLQNGTLRNRNSYTDALRSLDRTPSPEKTDWTPRTPGLDGENRSPERGSGRSSTPTPAGRDTGKETPSIRPSRPPLRPILGENSPSSATMLALQNMAVPKDIDTSLSDVTNKPNSGIRPPQSFDAISSQILSLTTIATSLQKEMAQLSRRSKDNATDLISLKEATNLRDEDIRKSLKDLSVNLSSRLLDPDRDHSSRAASSFGHRPGSFLLDSKPHNFDGSLPKSFSVPRMGSPGFNASDISGSTYNVETPAGIALLEKIWRDMGTKEGQEAISSALSGLKDASKIDKNDPQVMKKLEEILISLQESAGSRALVSLRNGQQAPTFDGNSDLRPAPLSRASRDIAPQQSSPKAGITPKAAEFVNEDLQKLLKKMKDSITEGGGMTAEVKAHLKELRGEVLGMGRDIARKLDQAESTSKGNRDDALGPGREEIAQIVEDGLNELRSHMEELIRERRRQSASSVASRHSVDSQEVYTAVKNALVEFPAQQLALQAPQAGIERDEILDAVREAWETYKPEIELQNFGLERDEILQCLKEGLQQYQPQEQNKDVGGATYEEVLDAVREGLEHFKPPPIETDASITREEILMTVRECLETFEFPVPHVEAPREPEITRDEVLDAVREGLSAQAPISKEIEFNRDDLFDAVKAGLQGTHTPMGGVGEQVLEKMEELIDGMRIEFKQYSEANGGDTEQVLDAMKDNLEVLRRDIETYVDRAQDVTGKDEIIDTMKLALNHLRDDLEETVAQKAQAPAPSSNVELLDAMEKEFEHLRTTLVPLLRSGDQKVEREEVLDAIRDGLEDMKSNVPRGVDPEDSSATLNVVRDEFSHLRETLATTLIRGGSSLDKEELLEAIRDGHESLRADIITRHDRPESVLSSTGELLDAFNDGLDSLRSDMEKMINKPLDMTVNYEILETLKEGLASVRSDLDQLQTAQSSTRGISSSRNGEVVIADPEAEPTYRNDIGKLEMMITQLRIKVEALDNMPPPTASINRDDFETFENMLRDLKVSVEGISHRDHSTNISRDDIEAFETLLRNTKAKVEDFGSSESDGFAKVTHIETLESLLGETRDAVADFESNGASKHDIETIEDLLKDIRSGMEEVRGKSSDLDASERVSKTDIEALETLCIDMKTQIEEHMPNPETLGSKDDLREIGESIQELGDQDSRRYELLASGFSARKIEHDHMTQCIDEVKLILEDVREELKARIKEDHHSVKDLAKTLDAIAETVMAADATATVGEVRETIEKEFEASRSASESIKEHNEENHTILLEKHSDHKQEIISDLTSKLDARFDEIMTKYDDGQLAAQAKEKLLDSKDAQSTEALNATKTAAEDLRLLVDALGSTVTDSCERMSEDSKTVFARVEEVGSKLEDLVAGDGKAEHAATRAEVARTLASVESLQAHISDYDPRIFEGIKDILNIVGQHYEQAKMSTEEIKTTVNAIPGAIPLPAIAPVAEATRELPSFEKYDDTGVHSKLDELVAHAAEAAKTGAELAALEQIREQVASTSEQLNDFVASQRAFQEQVDATKASEAEEAAIALEKRAAQKSIVESDIVHLSENKANLGTDVEQLLKEKSDLTSLKSKMQADLSSLETALLIRREELQIMENRAESLERRILDNVLDHSRSLLTTTSSRPPSSLNEMNRKRVVSTASSNATATTATTRTGRPTAPPSTNHSTVSSGIGMALKPRNMPRNSARNSTAASSQAGGRRILSLSTLSGNRGASKDRAMVLANPAIGNKPSSLLGSGGGGAMMKRSHSVKSNFPSRKSSWGGSKVSASGIMYADEQLDDDKENSVLDEEDEEGVEASEAGTERRTSYSGTYTGTMSSYSESGTGYFEDSEGKRTSYAPSTAGTIGTRDFALNEDEDEDPAEPAAPSAIGSQSDMLDAAAEQDAGEQGLLGASQESLIAGEAGGAGKGESEGGMVLYGEHGHNHSDSGIGTDLPTAALDVGGMDYFKK